LIIFDIVVTRDRLPEKSGSDLLSQLTDRSPANGKRSFSFPQLAEEESGN
jgi:hypothetical protein